MSEHNDDISISFDDNEIQLLIDEIINLSDDNDDEEEEIFESSYKKLKKKNKLFKDNILKLTDKLDQLTLFLKKETDEKNNLKKIIDDKKETLYLLDNSLNKQSIMINSLNKQYKLINSEFNILKELHSKCKKTNKINCIVL